MPVNFSRHNIEIVQRSNSYFLSEKTDGVRYLLVFTKTTAVLIDRATKGLQPNSSLAEPFQHIVGRVQPGTVLDGEIVVHRKLRRPVFIVFDVLTVGQKPILHLPFSQRLEHLQKHTFATSSNLFSVAHLKDPSIPCPLLRKNFVPRLELDRLLSNVKEERDQRVYRSGETHCHLTDGIIFQPDLPYSIGTDRGLLKWKYLDTVTIDVELLHPSALKRYRRPQDDDDFYALAVLGDEGSKVDVTKHVTLPISERLRLEADKAETGASIAEIGFDPNVGEWYYTTMRPDKIAPNHISTVLGTLLELAESLGTNELRYRMSVKEGARDSYRKDVSGMQQQMLDHQRKKNGVVKRK